MNLNYTVVRTKSTILVEKSCYFIYAWCMTFVSTMADQKGERIYIRVSEKIRDEFDIVAEHRGLTRSGLLHSLIVKTIHETKKEAPEIFERTANHARVNTTVNLEAVPTVTGDQEEFDNTDPNPSSSHEDLLNERRGKKKTEK
ncbi:MAG TPA: hypothetical protein VF556_17505 [Pyrinomonadaceae bacterium]|jgi:hypothetical protein